MAKRTQIVCLHEGKRGRSIDPLFIRILIKKINPAWIRPWQGNNLIRLIDCGGRSTLISRLPQEIKAAQQVGGNTTVMVWADVDDNMQSPEALKTEFGRKCEESGVPKQNFEEVVFAFAKDRLENWIEFLNTGATDESSEGPRVKDSEGVRAAQKLAGRCLSGAPTPKLPPSLKWSCDNWRSLKQRMT